MEEAVAPAPAAAPPAPRLGLSSPLSVALPTERDLRLTATLEEELRAQGLYESEQQRRQRERALELLTEAVEEWVQTVSAGKGKGLDVEASLLTFGSYRLGVHPPDADIDCLLVAPGHCDRAVDFFGIFLDLLAMRGDVTELQPVPDAFTPVAKFRLHGIAIDLLFARLLVPSVPASLVDVRGDRRDDPLLATLDPSDEPSVRSLNGGEWDSIDLMGCNNRNWGGKETQGVTLPVFTPDCIFSRDCVSYVYASSMGSSPAPPSPLLPAHHHHHHHHHHRRSSIVKPRSVSGFLMAQKR